ncbi:MULTISPECIES: energy-coupling factor ABC transporter permease [unclassified Thioalkalivibrio]|uniref:energy-coupling factor ABC transporter permease n=1 Tax=unclassified Thioalkalivibrio TaxID=2621013 RepID=UPI0003634FF6|nr:MULTISPECIES: energy-coupling factor ABC transporter permease [unclassified Thioalkalivibrio]PYG03278.1 putative membrane protein [Thioalkalivibrio sp. ALE21]
MAEGAADLPVALQVLVALLTGAGLVLMLRRMPWEAFFFPGRAQLFAGAFIALLVIWTLRAQTVDGLALHLMGMTAVTLVFGWQLAILLAFLVVGVLGLFGVLPMSTVPLTVLLAGILPVAVTWGLLRLTETRLPPHMFIYLYGVAFLGGALSAVVAVLGTAAVYGLFTELAWHEVYRDYVRYLPLLILPESVVNGIVVTALVVLRPGWLATWSDERYLHGR